MKAKILFKNCKDFNTEDYIKKVVDCNDFDTWYKGKDDDFDNYINIDIARELFLLHIEKKTDIYILQDCDLDGLYSSTMLAKWLKDYYKIEPTIIIHKTKKHGLNDDYVMKKLKNKNGLLIIPDASTNDVKECEELSSHLDIIILDHHEIEVANPYAIVVNNQVGNVNHNGSGTTVTYKFMNCVGFGNIHNFYQYETYVFLSLISDIMSFKNIYNRFYIYNQMVDDNFCNTDYCLNWLSQLDIQTIDDICSFHSLLNAIIRVGELKDKKYLTEMFLKDEPNFKEIMDLKKLGTACKNLQKSIVDETIEHNLTIINKDTEKDKLIVGITRDDTTLSGLIAFYLTLKYEKPCIVLHKDNDKYKGSGRSINEVDNLKTLLTTSKQVDFVQGHEGAFGVSFKSYENIYKAIEYVTRQTPSIVTEIATIITNKAELDYIINEIEEKGYGIWGTDLKKPTILYQGSLKLENVNRIGASKTVLKINNDVPIIQFSIDDDKFNKIFKDVFNKVFNKGKRNLKIYCLGKPNINIYKGRTYNQFIADKTVVM